MCSVADRQPEVVGFSQIGEKYLVSDWGLSLHDWVFSVFTGRGVRDGYRCVRWAIPIGEIICSDRSRWSEGVSKGIICFQGNI